MGSIEYKDRGALHNLHKVGSPSKNLVIKAAVKTTLAAETTALFAKDLAVNRFVGKETHIKFERKQSLSGKYHTHIKLVRADAPLSRPKGILHKAFSAGRFIEGDAPFRKSRPMPNRPKPKLVKLGGKAAKFGGKAAKAVLLTGESAVLKLGAAGTGAALRKLTGGMETTDSGRAVTAAASSLKTLNSGRKYLIRYRLNRREYKQLKATFKGKKLSVKSAKSKFKAQKSSFKSFKKRLKLKNLSKQNTIRLKGKVKYEKKLLKNEKRLFKTEKKLKKLTKKKKKAARVIPIGLLPFVPIGAAAKQLTASFKQKLVNADPNNDFMQGFDKSVRAVKSVNRNIVKPVKTVKNKLQAKNAQRTSGKLHKRQNKLTKKNVDLKNNRRKHIKKYQKKYKERAKEAAQKAGKAVINIAVDFTKFIFKTFGLLATPVLIGLLIFALIFTLFSSCGTNTTPWLIGTYNAMDKDLSVAIEEYTKIAYEFNQSVMKCGNTDEWKDGLSELGIDTSDLDTIPTRFTFGESEKFSATPAYDFDSDKLAAFMCAYTYDFANADEENDDIKNWEWDDADDAFIEVLQELFDYEYTFKCVYEDFSGWKQLNSYVFYGGGGADKSYWTVYSADISKSKIKIRAVPSEIKAFCDSDSFLHYDIDTLEVLDANNDDERTGYFIQDQRYTVTDPDGNSNGPFYKYRFEDNVFGFYCGTDEDGSPLFVERSSWYWVSDGSQIYYLVNPTDTNIWNSSLEDICLISFYQKNYWYEECDLFYTVEQNCTFDEAIEYLLSNKDDYSDERLEYYNTLVGEETETYGNHQTYSSPLSASFGELVSDGKIYNDYGYDIQAWNSEHCSLSGCHNGIDIEAASGSDVYAMISGKIDSIDTDKHTLTLISSSDIDYWYDAARQTKIIYTNISASVSVGDEVGAGDIIGAVDDYKHCYDNIDNSSAAKNYLHISVYLNYGFWDGEKNADPYFLICRD